MEKYSLYFALLANGGKSISAMIGWSLLGVLFSWLNGFWLAIICLPRNFREKSNQFFPNWIRLHPVAIAAGLAIQICSWTASLYLTGECRPGVLVLIVASFVSISMIWRLRRFINGSGHGLFILTGGIAFVIGLWLYAPTELVSTIGGVEKIVFSDYQKDLTIHATLAEMIKASGLPLKNFWSSSYEYGPLVHTGHIVLLAGFSELFGISSYAAAAVVWMITTLLTGWCALALVSKEKQSGAVFKLAVVVGTLVWGQFSLTNIGWPPGPLNPKFSNDLGVWVAARSYWNISQAISIAITFGGLLLLDLYTEKRLLGSRRTMILGAAVGLVTVAGWTKPSIIIFYGPALFIWLALSRAAITEYATTIIVIATGILIFCIPVLFYDLPSSQGWSLAIDHQQVAAVALFLWHSVISIFIVSFTVFVRSLRTGWKDRRFNLLDLGIVALGGSILFALIFRENQFVGFRYLQPNIWWGVSGSIILLVPIVAREIPGLRKQGDGYRWCAIFAMAVALIQILNGFSITAAYPVLRIRRQNPFFIRTLEAAHNKTEKSARFALDPALQAPDLCPYLPRPCLRALSFGPSEYLKKYVTWMKFCNDKKDSPPVDVIDAAILDKRRAHANRYFKSAAWQATPLNKFFTLWINPKFLINNKIKSIEASLRQGQENPVLYHELGLLYEKKGLIRLAKENYDKVLQLKPDSTQTLIRSAMLFLHEKEYNKAIERLKRIIKLQPENVKIYYNIACIYSMQNQNEVAMEWLKKAIANGYNNWEHIRTDKDLENLRQLPGFKELVKNK